VDRVPPAELLDAILAESAFGDELAGSRQAQARENLKKLRALARRVQNRGYATWARLAAHLDRLSAGDESNAIVDAAEAVNLMTVHAAKGLEFAFVFLVNIGRGTGGGGEPVLLLDDPRSRRALVSVQGGLREAEEASRERDREETKRLLYVALTRARERLYLAAVARDGRVQAGRGSLAEVMPASFLAVMADAAGGGGTRVEWVSREGGRHAFRVCRAPTPGQSEERAVSGVTAGQ
jgi:ATP-dependent exoDNAse (exonuclease V) beta subunit